MPTALQFETAVSVTGYEWVPDTQARIGGDHEPEWRTRLLDCWGEQSGDVPRLLLNPIGRFIDATVRSGGPIKRIQPTKVDTALFRNFAGIEPTQRGVIAFANEFGPLLGDRAAGDPIHEWILEIHSMRFLTELWEAVISRRATPAVAGYFRADSKGLINCHQVKSSLLNFYPYKSPPPRGQATVQWRAQGKPLVEAKELLMGAVNRRLLMIGVEMQLRESRGVTIQPVDLVGAMWIQFAEAIGEGKKYRKCEACPRYLELAIGRADKRYCNNACRNRALRQRQNQAIKLRDDGSSVKQIADKLESDTATVKKWLSAKKGK